MKKVILCNNTCSVAASLQCVRDCTFEDRCGIGAGKGAAGALIVDGDVEEKDAKFFPKMVFRMEWNHIVNWHVFQRARLKGVR